MVFALAMGPPAWAQWEPSLHTLWGAVALV